MTRSVVNAWRSRCASYRRSHAFLFRGWMVKSARIVVPVFAFPANRTRDHPLMSRQTTRRLRVSSTSLDRCRSRFASPTFQPPVESRGTRPGDLSRSIRCTSIDFTAKPSRFYNHFDFVSVSFLSNRSLLVPFPRLVRLILFLIGRFSFFQPRVGDLACWKICKGIGTVDVSIVTSFVLYRF